MKNAVGSLIGIASVCTYQSQNLVTYQGCRRKKYQSRRSGSGLLHSRAHPLDDYSINDYPRVGIFSDLSSAQLSFSFLLISINDRVERAGFG